MEQKQQGSAVPTEPPLPTEEPVQEEENDTWDIPAFLRQKN
jgi:hypothetical protein